MATTEDGRNWANQFTNPVTPEERAEIIRLHGEGKGRNEIARLVGRAQRTVTLICEEENLTFDRTATAVATEARKTDAKARRAAIIDRAYARVEKLLDRLDEAESGEFQFTASTVNGIETATLDHVPGQEEKALAGAISSYLAQAAKLEAIDGDPGVEAARSMLGALAEGLNQLAGADRGEGDDSGEG
ncbi:helix-turn-helix domain-containing protein [Streptomyces werraensis]|uniref:helix-turn-helix domain-containing protein n=1 Tax=Streptomyces werraensis TaxID=68284 RepID=UPI0038181C42